MRSLIYKDYQSAGWLSVLYYLPTLAISGLALMGKYSPILCLLVFILTAEFSLGIWMGDAKANYIKYSEVLPVSRQKTVNEKFLMILANSLYSLILVESCLIIGNVMRGENAFGINNAMVLTTFFAVLSICGIGMMLMMLLNYNFSIAITAVFGGFLGGFSSFVTSSENIFALETGYRYAFLSRDMFHICTGIICTILFTASWIVSVVVYKRKNI